MENQFTLQSKDIQQNGVAFPSPRITCHNTIKMMPKQHTTPLQSPCTVQGRVAGAACKAFCLLGVEDIVWWGRIEPGLGGRRKVTQILSREKLRSFITLGPRCGSVNSVCTRDKRLRLIFAIIFLAWSSSKSASLVQAPGTRPRHPASVSACVCAGSPCVFPVELFIKVAHCPLFASPESEDFSSFCATKYVFFCCRSFVCYSRSW